MMIVNQCWFECWNCGIPFGLSEGFVDSATNKHTTFYCPRGCRLAFGESASDKLQKEKEALERTMQAKINESNHARLVAERERDKIKREKRKVERRIAHGVCPCCNKTFNNIANHMVTEHKEFRLPAGKKLKEITGIVQ